MAGYDNKTDNFRTRLNTILEDKDHIFYERFESYLESQAKSNLNTTFDREGYKAKLDELKKRKKLTIDDITFITGKNRSSVARWIVISKQGDTVPDIQVVTRMAKAFNVSTDYLLGIDGTLDHTLEAEYAEAKSCGLSADSYANLKAIYETSINRQKFLDGDANIVINNGQYLEGINRLLSKDGLPLMKEIAYFLALPIQLSDFTFDSDDWEIFTDGLLNSYDNANAESISKKQLEQELEDFKEKVCFNLNARYQALIMIESIKDKLKEYKELLTPGFFTERI